MGGKGKGGQRVQSAQGVADEAHRRDGAHPHIKDEDMRPPIIRYGVTPDEAVQMATKWAEQAKDPRGRKLRIDGLCLGAGVFSVPDDMPDDWWPEYRDEMIEHLKTKYGKRLKSVVEHVDEGHRHCHFYLVPEYGEDFGAVQPGVAAARASAARGDRKGLQNAAYKAAMIRWQDEIHAVSTAFGLARIGPRRRRLPTQQYKAERLARTADAAIYRAATPKMSMDPINRIMKEQTPKHRAGLLGTGEPLYTAAQIKAVATAAAVHGVVHVKSHREGVLDAVLGSEDKIMAAEARLKDLAAQEAVSRAALTELGRRVADAEEIAHTRIQEADQRAELAEGRAREAESWAERAVAAVKTVITPVLTALFRIIQDPKELEPKHQATRAIAALVELRPLAALVEPVVIPVAEDARRAEAKATKGSADGLDWAKKVRKALGTDFTR